MDVLILGANGFIGSHLCETILSKTDWQIHALDIDKTKISPFLSHPRLNFFKGDMILEQSWITTHLQKSDIVIPLAAIAHPQQYIVNPLKVFELDFEANLQIIRQCVKYNKYLIFPSTSEVYGMCEDAYFDEEESFLVTGPIQKERWIYASSKQLLDRIIYAYGKHSHLNYTIFRPFNWYGPRLDHLQMPGASRVLTQFIGNILRGEDVLLVEGGLQKRSFTYIDDGINALLKIIENKENNANRKIFNIGNPYANISIRELAEYLISLMKNYPQFKTPSQLKEISAPDFYGVGYQDILQRVPSIARAEHYLAWKPLISLEEGLQKTLEFYIHP